MSADNGVYIAQFPDGFRVCHGFAIENIDFFPVGSKERKEELKRYFGESKLFASKSGVWKEAHKLYEEVGHTEYGVTFLGMYELFQ